MYHLYSKLLFFALLFPLGVMEAQEYEIKTITIEVELPEYKVNNDSFLYVIDSLILKQNFSTEFRKDYVYLTRIDKRCIEYTISITLIRPTFISDSRNLGFFRRQDALFLIQGNIPDNLVIETMNKKIILYKKNVIELNGKDIDYDNLMPEEFITWSFLYFNGEFKFMNGD